jgi:hypothetical protein
MIGDKEAFLNSMAQTILPALLTGDGQQRRLYLMTVCGYSGGKLERLLR